MTAVLPPPAAVLPLAWQVTCALPDGRTRTVTVDAELMWDGRTPAELAAVDLQWRTGIPALYWTATAVYPAEPNGEHL